MLFIITAMDKDDGGKARAENRAAHFAYLRETGGVKLGGPFLGADGKMIGSLIILEAEGLEAAKRWAANDPYQKAGVFAHSELNPWQPTINDCGATF